MNREKLLSYDCPVEAAVDVIGGKYKVIIIWNLIDKTLRYCELRRAIPKATPKMLSQQLKELEADGIINRILYPVVPPKTEYSLTEMGNTLAPIICDLCKWGEAYYQVQDIASPCAKHYEQEQCRKSRAESEDGCGMEENDV
ncbi:MAG: winged helix-turn-helix transcriptional regulator [Lachnospiraceae bacterium]